jgi:thioredoxin 1
MKKQLMLLILLAAVLFITGCSEKTQNNSTNSSQNSSANYTLVEATRLEQINASLEKGPVLVKIGADWCEDCQEMEKTLSTLASEYGDRVTIMKIDIDRSPKLATYFNYYVIPDTFVITGIKNGEYVYMQEDGNITTDRSRARILKLEEKTVFEKTLNYALKKEKTRSKK